MDSLVVSKDNLGFSIKIKDIPRGKWVKVRLKHGAVWFIRQKDRLYVLVSPDGVHSET